MNEFDPREESAPEKEINLLDFWMAILKRKWLVMSVALVVMASVAFKTFTTPSTYTARGTLLIERETNILSFEQMLKVETFQTDYYMTQFNLLRSRSVAERAIEKVNLYQNEEFVGKPEKRGVINKDDPVFKANLITAFLGRLMVDPIRQTRLAEVRFNAHNPKLAADSVNAVLESFIAMNIENKYSATEEATEFLAAQIASLRSDIERKERGLQAYGVEKNIIALSDKETTIIGKLAELNKFLTDAQIDLVNKEAFYTGIKNATPNYIPDSMLTPMIQNLKEDYGKLSRDYEKKLGTYKPDYPEMQRLRTDLESVKAALDTEMKNVIKGADLEYQAALKKERSLQEVFNRQKLESIQMNSNAILYNSLKVEVEGNKTMLETLMKRQSETGVSARLSGLRTSSIRIIDRAEVPRSPSGPNKKKNLFLALIMGLAGGIGLALFFDYLDSSVKSAEDCEKYAKLPTLGIVPTFSQDGFRRGYGYGYGYGYGSGHKRSKSKPAVTATGAQAAEKGKEGEQLPNITSVDLIPYISPKSNFSETYRSIRTALLLSSADSSLKTLVITSSLPSEGKTATLANLAVTLAQANKRVLIIDTDIRRPRQHRIFKIKNLNGLTNYLTGDLEIKSLIKPTQIPNLFLINAGPVPPNPAELLGSEKMHHFIEDLKQTFDYILFDSPPVLAVSDALVLGSKTDAIILVVWGGKTNREALKRAKEKLDLMKIKCVGVIINRLDLKQHDYYYKHYYYQYYGES